MDTRAIQHFKAHDGLTYSINYSMDGKKAATTSYDGRVFIWDAVDWTRLNKLMHTQWVYATSWHPTDSSILTCGGNGVSLWNLQTGTLEKRANLLNMRSVAWFPNGERFVCGDEDGILFVYACLK
jgi:WD40 repeat protein